MADLIAYLRVSTGKQVEEGLGLDVQEAVCRAWAGLNDHVIVGVEADEGISGTKDLDNRAALSRALAAVKSGRVAGVVVYRLDRWARDLILQEQLLVEIRRAGGELFTTSGAESDYLTDDPKDPSRKLIRQVLGAVSEYERSMIALRLAGGRAAKRSNGGYAGGYVPLGTRLVNGEFAADEVELEAIDRIRTLHDDGLSLRQIVMALEDEGVPTKRGGHWYPATVARVLSTKELIPAY